MAHANGKRSKGRSLVKTLAALTLILSVGAAAYMGYQAWAELSDRKEGESFYEQFALNEKPVLGEGETAAKKPEGAVSAPEETAASGDPAVQTASPAADDADTAPASSAGSENGQAQNGDATVEDMTVKTANEKRNLDFAQLKASYPDIVCWLEVPAVGVDYPVMQGTDNDYYLHHLPGGKYNFAGSIMMDVSNNASFKDQITILHGHNMNNGSMFGRLSKFKSSGFCEENPEFTVYTPDGVRTAEIIAALTVDGNKFGYPTNFATQQELDDFLASVRGKSAYRSDVRVGMDDKMILLSTCAYSFTDARFVVLAKLK